MSDFVDETVLHARAGDGGHGCASVHREKFKPLGGPDGGNGGRGGDVILAVDPRVATLLDYHRRPHRRASSGRPGKGSDRAGASGEDLLLGVPDGTVVRDADGTVLADLTGAGTRYVVAAGGRGGLGNAALATPRRRAPGFALRGEPGQHADVRLEMKSIADVGLVGFPSAGKSSLIAAISAARPKIADYPFTTLVPNLGVVEAGETQYVIADVPGLIPGASEGRGLGLEFLRHVERCSVLVHVIDCATTEPGRDPVSDYEAIEAELAAYGARVPGGDLADRPRIVLLNKVDMADAAELAQFVRPMLADRGLDVHEISAASRQGLREVTFALAEIVAQVRAATPEPEPSRVVLHPRAAGDTDSFTVTKIGPDTYAVRGDKPERWVRQTDFGNDEAVGYLADRLARLGVEAELTRLGATAGVTVAIGGDDAVVFDWDPATPAGGTHRHGPRGTDTRL